MLKSKLVVDDGSPVAPLTPGLLAKIRKEDMKQAIYERFSARRPSVAPRVEAQTGARSPYWQPADEQC